MIRLVVPAELRFRDVAVRTVAAACKLVGPENERHGWTGTGVAAGVKLVGAEASSRPTADSQRLDLNTELEVHLVSAFSEAFNNIVIHAYGRRGGQVEIDLDPQADCIVVFLRDRGISFDPSKVDVPELDKLPESGMGLFIIHSFVDEFSYTPGQPNVWRLTKRLDAAARQVGTAPTSHRLDG